MDIYGGSCLVLVRENNKYPILVFGCDQKERAEHLAKVNGGVIVRCISQKDS